MSDANIELPWIRSGWLERVHAWIQNELDQQTITLSGSIEQLHVRPWSTVLTVPTDHGLIYFKAISPTLAHEPRLTMALSRWMPECMPPAFAIEDQQGWMLLADAGVTMRCLIQADGDMRHWEHVLPPYAEAQIQLADRLDDVLALGVFDRRLALLPDRYAQILADPAALRMGLDDGLAKEEVRLLHDAQPRFVSMCDELAQYGLPETLHHDDFHDGNIFVRDGRYTLADWGESCAAHPFFTLVVLLRSIAYRFELTPSDPRLLRLRDIYLEPWTSYAPRRQPLAAAALAQQIGAFCRALTWYEVVSPLEEPYRTQHAEATPGWLQEFLHAVQESSR